MTAPPVRVTELPPVVPVTLPPHWDALGTLASVTPVGKVSVNPTPFSATVFANGFVMVNVSADVPLAGMGLGRKDFAMLGGCGRGFTVSISHAAV